MMSDTKTVRISAGVWASLVLSLEKKVNEQHSRWLRIFELNWMKWFRSAEWLVISTVYLLIVGTIISTMITFHHCAFFWCLISLHSHWWTTTWSNTLPTTQPIAFFSLNAHLNRNSTPFTYISTSFSAWTSAITATQRHFKRSKYFPATIHTFSLKMFFTSVRREFRRTCIYTDTKSVPRINNALQRTIIRHWKQ